MSTPRFFCPLPLAAGQVVELPDAVARHAGQVLRLAAGSAVVLFTGEGGEFTATLESLSKRNVTVRVGEYSPVEREPALAVVLNQALTSTEKMDWIVQKAVELGATRIQPFIAERSVVRLGGERADKRIAHWQAVAIAACEQCGRNRIPSVGVLEAFGSRLATAGTGTHLLLDPQGQVLPAIGVAAPPVQLWVGPEGGFSHAEAALLGRLGAQPVRLGPRILRTETAGLAALAALQALHGDFR